MKTNIPWEDSSQDQEECRLPQSTNIRCLPCGIIACAPKIPPLRVFVFSLLQFSLLAICWHFLKFDLFAYMLMAWFGIWRLRMKKWGERKSEGSNKYFVTLLSSSATILWELPSGPQSHTKRILKSPPLTSLSCLCKSGEMFPRICFPIIRWTETELFISCSKPSGERSHDESRVSCWTKRGTRPALKPGLPITGCQ